MSNTIYARGAGKALISTFTAITQLCAKSEIFHPVNAVTNVDWSIRLWIFDRFRRECRECRELKMSFRESFSHTP